MPGHHRATSLTDSPPAFTWILLIGLCIRIAYAAGSAALTPDLAPFHHPDTDSYLEPAFDLVSFEAFSNRNQPELLRTFGYPLLLQLGVWMGEPEVVTVVLQLLLSALSIAGVFVLARELFREERIALAAAALYAIEPLSIIYAAQLVTETYFTTMVVWALVLLVLHVRRGDPASLIGAMTLLAFSVHVRPIGVYLPVLFIGLLGAWAAAQRRWMVWKPLTASIVLTLVILLPWVARNRALGFNGVSTVSAVNLYFYNTAALRALRTGQPFSETQWGMGYQLDSAYFALHPEQREWRIGERYGWMAGQARNEILGNQLDYTRLHVSGVVRVVAEPGIFGALKAFRLYPQWGGLRDFVLGRGMWNGFLHLTRNYPAAVFLIGAFTLILAATWGFAIRGVVLHYRDRALQLLGLTVVYFLLISGGPVGEGRFRHPVMPLLCVLAAGGLARFRRRVAESPTSPIPATTASLAGNTPGIPDRMSGAA